MLSFCLALALAAPVVGARSVDFNRDVRPILADKCFTCHGPDALAKKVPLRLDSEAAAKAVVKPGDPAASRLILRVAHPKPPLRMPPPNSGLKLSEAEIDTLRRWVAEGAKWEGHWAFQPPRRQAPPPVKNAAWPRNPIDSFVLERLEKEGLRPSPEAPRATLLRRAALDITGLPPPPQELGAFLNDRSGNAYEKAVDRLLASPRYGERMAARWLDAARYADTNGYQYDGERVMWRWRDWVIEAFNRNMPFDQFTLEQIAGDLLPGATVDQKIATGFNRNHRGNTEDGIVPEEYAVEYVVDRVETTSTVFLGLTLGCARCHNHKYDPFTQKEFYQIYAYFNNIPEQGRAMKYGNSPPLVPAPTRQQRSQLEQIEARIAKLEKELRQAAPPAGWSPPKTRWGPSAGLTVAFDYRRERQFDGKDFVDAGDVAGFDIEDRFTVAAWIYSEETPDGPVVTRMNDKLKGRGYGLHVNQGKIHVHLTSNWDSDAIRMEGEEPLAAGQWHHLAFTYTGSRMAEGVTVYVNGKPVKMRVESDTLYRPFRNAGNKFRDPLRIGGGWGEERRFRGKIDGVRLYGRVLDAREMAALALDETLDILAAKTSRTEAEEYALREYYLEHEAASPVRNAWQHLAEARLEKLALERKFPTVMVMEERPVRRPTFLLVRGAYDKPGEEVEPGLPAVLPPLPKGAPNNRLGFAKWLIDPANPLTARVTVNRLWQMFFGAGIVKTTEDFGAQGEWPSHPELLDWLATEFVRTGWDVKAMLKLIVTSATYRQSSSATPELLQKDPENRLLARGPRFRLPAEMIRDQALFAAGLLAEKLGGPSVMPYQPEGLWKETSMQDMYYVQSKGEDLYRRSLYTFWKRTIAPPMMMNFDSAARESCVVRETRTNTPLQALNLMNDITFVEAARMIGQRMMREGGSAAADRLRYGFRLITSREPEDAELAVLQDSLRYHTDYFASDAARVKQYLAHGETPPDPKLDARELAAYAAVANLLLNLDEAVNKE
jgi:hypothetical protein